MGTQEITARKEWHIIILVRTVCVCARACVLCICVCMHSVRACVHVCAWVHASFCACMHHLHESDQLPTVQCILLTINFILLACYVHRLLPGMCKWRNMQLSVSV